MDLAIQASNDVHMFCYDNINLSTSIFTEQRGAEGPSKVTSGTFGIIYKLRNAAPKDMEMAPIMERLRKSTGLQLNNDFLPKKDQRDSFRFQLQIVIVRVLTTYAKGFEFYTKYPELQHRPRRAIPAGYKTEQFPLRVTTIEEASITGNLLYHDEVYLNLLKRSTELIHCPSMPFRHRMISSQIAEFVHPLSIATRTTMHSSPTIA